MKAVMQTRNGKRNVLPTWTALAIFVIAGTLAVAQKKTSAPAAAPSHSAPSAPHAPQGGGGAQHPSGASSTNRGPGGMGNSNRGPGGANTANHSPAGQGNRMGQNGANRSGQNGANQNGANRAGQNGANRGGQNGGNRSGQNSANRGGEGNGKGGGQNAANKGGAAAAHQPAGSKTVALKNGGSATFRKDGKVRSIQAHGMTINHGMHGNTHIRSTHNGRTVVSHGRYGGYSQRAYYNHGGRSYVQRTYYVGGRYYAYGYGSYSYGGYPYYAYAPAYYYGPAYYGWAYNPWASPVTYGWGWGGAPWYGYYGAYYQPYPVYPYAALWLTDYLISANLQAAYAAQAAAGDGGGGDGNGEMLPPAISNASADEIAALWSTDPLVAAQLQATYGVYMLGGGAPPPAGSTKMPAEVKQAIADQMKRELAAEKDAAAAGSNAAPAANQVPPAINPDVKYFVLSTDEDLTTSDSVECELTPGDVIYRTTDTPDDDHMVNATVKSSKKDECAIGVTVAISVDELQEMHNQLRIKMDAGLKELADKQGKNGLPAAPDTKTQVGEVPAPSPDTNTGNDLKQQQTEAQSAEAEAKQSQQ